MILAKAIREALELLTNGIPKNAEVSIAGVEEQTLWMGMGYCVGKKWVVYRGAYDFRITPAGRKALAEIAADT